MSLHKYFDRVVPRAVAYYSTLLWDRIAFEHLGEVACDTRAIARLRVFDRAAALERTDLDAEWRAVEPKLAALGIASHAGGVNAGDRRALYYLVKYLRPRRVLEIGTHVGASTVHIAAAIAALRKENAAEHYDLTTVDVEDCNSPTTKPWLKLGSKYSPAEMVERLGYASFVRFVVQDSLAFLAECGEPFDLVFLDGFHTASHVLREIPAALAKLRKGAHVLLHDYYPGARPLWSDGHVERGPYLAVQKLRDAGAALEVMPLGALPWPTKAGSHVTSLALLGGS